jgi:hypothetical protein
MRRRSAVAGPVAMAVHGLLHLSHYARYHFGWPATVGRNEACQFLWEVLMRPETIAESSGAAILSCVLKAHASRFTPEVARSILQLKFDQIDIDRMNALAEKNSRGVLTETEQQELQSYLLVGHLLDLRHSKARLALRQTAP